MLDLGINGMGRLGDDGTCDVTEVTGRCAGQRFELKDLCVAVVRGTETVEILLFVPADGMGRVLTEAGGLNGDSPH